MTSFAESHLGKLQALVGTQLLLVPGARIVIENSDGQVLLQQRSDFKIWGLPGGNAEPGEDLSTSIEREVLEETGLIITGQQAFGFGSDPKLETHTFPNGDQCQFFVLNFFCKEFDGTLKAADDESLKIDWFDINDLPRMLPNMKASIEAYKKFVRNGLFQTIEA